MEDIVTQNYDAWNAMAKNIAYVAWAISILIVLYHVVRLATMNDAKIKYDYINRSEIRTLWIAAIILIVGCCFYANSNVQKLNTLWIFVLGFTTFAMGMIVPSSFRTCLSSTILSLLRKDSRPFGTSHAFLQRQAKQ